MIFWPSELAEEPERPSQEARVAPFFPIDNFRYAIYS